MSLLDDLKVVKENMGKKLNQLKELQNKVSLLEEEKLELQAQIDALEEEKANHVCEANHDECEAKATELQNKIDSLQKEIDEHVCPVCDHSELDAKIAELEQARGELEASNRAKDEVISEHEANIVLLQVEVDELKKLLGIN